MFFWNKNKSEEVSRINPGYEEHERRTPLAGSVLLLLMFIIGMFFGWNALDDLAGIPLEPERLSYCANRFRPAYIHDSIVNRNFAPDLYYEYGGNYNDFSKCVFNALEKKAGIDTLFSSRNPLTKEEEKTSQELATVSQELAKTKSALDRLNEQYNLGLQEKQADVQKPLFEETPTQQQVKALNDSERSLTSQKNSLESQLSSIQAQIRPIDDKIREAYKPVFEQYNRELRWFDFKVFLLQFFFTLPFFWVAYALYLKLHKKNSPYTIIFTAILGVAGILLLRVVLVWFWGLFLQSVLETLIVWFRKFQVLRSIIYYGGMILSFVVFGGAVYLLQRKIFDPRRITLRRFRARQCPYCQTDLQLSGAYCPNCGNQIREKCSHCGGDRLVGLPACPSCGSAKQ